MVTLSGLIVAVGMVVDASIVVLENIYRHFKEMKEPNARIAAREGASEVSLAVTAGMMTTVIVLVPVMFSGGYTQQTMRPLNLMISAALLASLLVALTVIPLMASRLLGRGSGRPNAIERLFGYTDKGVGVLARMYMGVLRKALHWRIVALLLAAGFYWVTMQVVPPLIAGELQPAMDTGIVTVEVETPTEYNIRQVEHVLSQVEDLIYCQPGVLTTSSVVGSEPGQISFGGGGATVQSIRIIVRLVDRMHRNHDIWEIQDEWREALREIPGVKSFRVTEYGATPVSTTKAPLDIIVSGPDSSVVDGLAEKCLEAIKGVPGLVDVRRSWYVDKLEQQVIVDPALARLYDTSPAQTATELKAAVKGLPAGSMRLKGFLDIPIWVQYAAEDIQEPSQLQEVYVPSRFGPLPLRAIARVEAKLEQPFITRERLQNTIDVTGVNRIYTIGQVAKMVNKRVAGIPLPHGYAIEVSGTPADMATGSAEMNQALKIGLVLLYLLLLAMFKSFRHPAAIMAAIPLAIAGAMWGLLLFDKPMCKPGTMGMILLGGTVVNNSILLLDFILNARKAGIPKDEAILQSVRLRIRPILITTVSTIVGLIPLAFEMAVGLERMSPLGVVASTGLFIGTFMTLIVIPVVYSSLESLMIGWKRVWQFLLGTTPPTPQEVVKEGSMDRGTP